MSLVPHDLVKAVVAVGRRLLIIGWNDRYLAADQLDAGNPKTGRLHRLDGALDIGAGE
jgi:hypothetical protein